jgi:hypothetical protein
VHSLSKAASGDISTDRVPSLHGFLNCSLTRLRESTLGREPQERSLNRSMGLRDAYPFAPSGKVVAKLHFVHDLVARFRGLP